MKPFFRNGGSAVNGLDVLQETADKNFDLSDSGLKVGHSTRNVDEVFIEARKELLLAKDPRFIQSFLNTLLFVMLVVPLQCGLALGLALLINRQLRGISVFRALFFSPVVTSIVVVSIVWTFLYHRDVGVLNHYLQADRKSVV